MALRAHYIRVFEDERCSRAARIRSRVLLRCWRCGGSCMVNALRRRGGGRDAHGLPGGDHPGDWKSAQVARFVSAAPVRIRPRRTREHALRRKACAPEREESSKACIFFLLSVARDARIPKCTLRRHPGVSPALAPAARAAPAGRAPGAQSLLAAPWPYPAPSAPTLCPGLCSCRPQT